jgi:hypothetical protein
MLQFAASLIEKIRLMLSPKNRGFVIAFFVGVLGSPIVLLAAGATLAQSFYLGLPLGLFGATLMSFYVWAQLR